MSLTSAFHSLVDAVGDLPDHIKNAIHEEASVPEVPNTPENPDLAATPTSTEGA